MEQELKQNKEQARVQGSENKITEVKAEQGKKPKAHVSDEKKKLVKRLKKLQNFLQ